MTNYKRSPFLFIYWNEKNEVILYNYNRHTKAVLSKDVLKILEILYEWKSYEEIYHALKIDSSTLRKALQLLVKLKFVHKEPIIKEDSSSSGTRIWEPVDLAFQRQRSFGGAYPMSDRMRKSPSPVKHVKGLSSVALPKVHNSDNNEKRHSLLDTLNNRKSIRKYSKYGMNKSDLSRFLYHSARIKKIYKSDQGTLTKRPYPSGGGRYPLEIYVLNNRISDIQKGLYYYDPYKHKLLLLSRNKKYQREFNEFILDVQGQSMNREPDIVLIITAVFARTMWKYSKIALSLIMSDLGCLYQTMYLVATEMNLAPCPIGGTHEQLVRDWLNLHWFEESHVGTFMLGNTEQRYLTE